MIGGRLEQLSISRRRESCSEAWCCSRTPGGRRHHPHVRHHHRRHRHRRRHHYHHYQQHHCRNHQLSSFKSYQNEHCHGLNHCIMSITNAKTNKKQSALQTLWCCEHPYLTKWSFGLWPCDHENPCLTWSLWTNGASSAKVVCPRRKWTCRRKSLKEAPKLMAYWLSIEQRQNGISASVWSFEGEFYRRKHSLGSWLSFSSAMVLCW